MLAYGLPRYPDVEFPDVADIKNYGLKSSIGRVPKKSGVIPSYFKSSVDKRQVRRYWKRRARQAAKKELRQYF